MSTASSTGSQTYCNDEQLSTKCFVLYTNRENCILSTGSLVSKVEPTCLGGSMNVTFACNGCKLCTVNFSGSVLVEGSKQTVVRLALAVAFFITGHGYAKFSRPIKAVSWH